MKAKKGKRKAVDHRTRVGKERSARTQSRILQAALKVFAEMGPDAAKIDDFVRAANISRGTFYNYYQSVEELLAATSEWTTRETIQGVEDALEGLEDPALRLATGLRLFFARGQSDPVWCRFVARVWKWGGLELPMRDVERGLRLGVFRAPDAMVALDLLLGVAREGLTRIGAEATPPSYGTRMAELCLQALGVDARRIAAALAHPLPVLSPRSGGEGG